MSLRSKTTAVGLSATLLASLVATIAAPAAFAAGTVTKTGGVTVPRGNDYVGTAAYTFAEGAVNDFGTNDSITVSILDSAGNNTLSFDASSATLQAPDTLAATLSVSGNTFTVTFGDNEPTKIEAFTVGNLKVKAAANAALGAIQTKYTTNFGAYFGGNTTTISGTLAAAYSSSAATVLVNVANTSSPFVDTTAAGASDYTIGGIDYAGTATALGCGGTCTSGQQNLTLTGGLDQAQSVGDAVTQTITDNAGPWSLPSIGSVVDSLALSAPTSYGVQPGEANQQTGDWFLDERASGYLAAGTVITAKLTEPGVTWSAPPVAYAPYGNGGLGNLFTLSGGYGTLSTDKTTATWTVLTADTGTAFGGVEFKGNIDVASSATLGRSIKVTVTAGSLNVIPASVEIAYINNVITAAALSLPTVYIGENDQATGTLQIKETAAGSFQSTGSNNNLVVCLYGYENFVRQATAVVIAGDLKLRDPATLGPSTSVLGTLAGIDVSGDPFPTLSCQSWSIYSASTVASTIEIREVAATAGAAANGPHINVPGNLTPGQVVAEIGATDQSHSATSWTEFDLVPIANRVYRNSPVVESLSAPAILRGHSSQAAGDVRVRETSVHQLGSNEALLFRIVPNSLLDLINPRVFFQTLRDVPVVSTNAESGLTAHFLGFQDKTSFLVGVDQRAFPPTLGQLTVSNIKYSTTADAPLGPVQLEVCTGVYNPLAGPTFTPDACNVVRGGGSSVSAPATSDTYVAFDQSVTNAKVVSSAAALNADIAKGVTRTSSAFTLATVVVKNRTYVTVRIKAAGAAPGDVIQIWTKTKTGAWKATTSRLVSADGYAYYFTKTNGWMAYRGYFAGNDTSAAAWSNAVRALGK